MQSCLRPNTKNTFNETINWTNIWQTLNSRFIQNYDYDIIYILIENSFAVWKQLSDWKTNGPLKYACFANGFDTILHAFFYCSVTKKINKKIKNKK